MRLGAHTAALADDPAVFVLRLALAAGPPAVRGLRDGRVALGAAVVLGGAGARGAGGVGRGHGEAVLLEAGIAGLVVELAVGQLGENSLTEHVDGLFCSFGCDVVVFCLEGCCALGSWWGWLG